MQCHYCDDPADISVERGGVKVGLCGSHFRRRMDELKNDGWLDDLKDDLQTDRLDR
ncbi:DUF6757 family protein [Halomarina oriensis]|uniref:DUF6757 family protein n=1 Tax=Halomarina oriensis TaxID=671145 RepID=UPI0018EEE3EF|nr:DUF6757 family protein [Halomarina oriensis]